MAGIINLYAVIAVFIYLLVCVMLYILQFHLYAGVLRTVFIHASIIPPIILLSHFISGKSETGKEKTILQTRLDTAITWSLTIFSVIASGYSIYKNPHSLVGYQALFLILTCIAIMLVVNHKKRTGTVIQKVPASIFVSMLYSSILIVTIMYLLIVRPFTVNAAQKLLQAEGYQNVSYVMNFQDEVPLHMLLDDKTVGVNSMAAGLGVYLFSGEIDGEDYGIFVDVAKGDISAYEKLKDNTVLSNVIELKRAE